MNPKNFFSPRKHIAARLPGRQSAGVALLIVLGMLVLLSVIVVAFITSVTTDLADSKAYESQTSTRMLADSAVSLVIAEIRTASTTGSTAWISQPGLVRTFDNSGNTTAYKLYSAPQMIVNGSFDPNAGTDLPSAASTTPWYNQPNLYTDLNSPIAVNSGSMVFPIIDGNGLQSIPVSGSSVITYSISGSIPSIEGFSTNPTAVGNTFSTTQLTGSNNPVPMPVQWLYMLKDGTLIPATAAGNSKDVTFAGTVVPTGTNPIVARIAFWTDDESCKVNINTASEGTFWDTPVAVTQPNVNGASAPDPMGSSIFDPNQIFEWDLAMRQPDQREYQRYPGHPATTCLSPILGDYVMRGLNLTGTAGVSNGLGYYGYHTLTGTGWTEFAEYINQLAPRISGSDTGNTGNDYSSRAGSYRPGGSSLNSSTTSAYITGSTSGTLQGSPITPDNDRLYSSVDDMFFSGTTPAAATNRVYNGELIGGTTTAILTPALFEKAKFFLTADSKSPEQNIFNMPRVCIWPITRTQTTMDNPDTSVPAVTATMTSFDKVIAFCATVGGTTSGLGNRVPFYFTRYDPFSPTNDFAQSTNNQNLYAYLDNYMNTAFPGFGNGTISSKYTSEEIGGGYNQILTEIFDYIRCTNLADISEDVIASGNYGTKSYTMINPTSVWTDNAWGSYSSQGQVVPIILPVNAVSPTTGVAQGTPATMGFGRIATIGEMSMIILKQDDRINPADAENAPETQITVNSGVYSGTWILSSSGPVPNVPNYQNVLIADPSQKIYQKPYPNGTTPPTTDQLLLPGAGGMAASGTYDPRQNTKIQIALLPQYFSPMAGYSAMGHNVRFHWTNLNIQVSGSAAVTPGFAQSGTQGQDLYESGRVEGINQAESKIGGLIGVKMCLDPLVRSGNPPTSGTGAPMDSMPQVLETVVSGTSLPGGGFNTSGSNTISISGSGTLQVIAPGNANGITWAARGINDHPTVIQTINFRWPTMNVPIPTLTLASTGNFYAPFVNVQLGAASTLSGNPTTGESIFLTAAAQGKVKTGGTSAGVINRIDGVSQSTNNYTQALLCGQAPSGGLATNDIVRSLPLSGTLASGYPVDGDLRMVAASPNVPNTLYIPMPVNGSGTAPTPYFDPTKQFYYMWEAACGYGSGNWFGGGTVPMGYLYVNTTSGTTTPQYAGGVSNRPYIPVGINGVMNYLGNPGDWDNGPGWMNDGAYVNKGDEGWVRHMNTSGVFMATSCAPFIGHPYSAEDAGFGLESTYSPNRIVSSPVMFGSLPTGVVSGRPWQTLLFRPAKSYLPGGNNHPGAAAPNPTDGSIPAPPYTTPPDHLLLDLFWMPVVDPYPISEPFATAGKVNLNYQIAPFTYITRKTALRAVMQSVKITAMNPYSSGNAGGNDYLTTDFKSPGSYGNDAGEHASANSGVGQCLRRNIDIEDTLRQIDQLRFANNKPFITASEICDVPLIPADLPTNGATVPYNIGSSIQSAAPSGYDAILQNFWFGNPTNTSNSAGSPPQFGHRETGDNSMERPYTMIYPRLTTKSNTYTVHVRVQTLKKATTTPVAVFKDGQDQVMGEFRGSFVIERYLDPGSAGFYTNGNPSSPTTMNAPGAQLGPYKFRIISSKQFGQ